MKIWRVGYRAKHDEHLGFTFHSTMQGSQKAAHEDVHPDGIATIQEFAMPLTKVGILNFLNQWCSHPDNEYHGKKS